MDKIKIAVVGDIALDVRRAGTSTRTSPEDPNCKVLSNLTTTYELGMAGNVAAWLAAQEECSVTLCGLVGGDDGGQRVMNLCGHLSITPCFPGIWDKDRRVEAHGTTVKERICRVEGGRILQLVRCDRDSTYEINEKEHSRIVEEVVKADLVVVADYGKGVFKGEHGETLIDWLGFVAKNTTVVVNSKFPNQWEGYPIAALICNEKEAMDALVERGGDCALLTENYIVTAGKKGVNAYCPHYGSGQFPALAKKVIDVTGGGDAFSAGFAFAYHRMVLDNDMDMEFAIQTGQEWAAKCCSKIGCSP